MDAKIISVSKLHLFPAKFDLTARNSSIVCCSHLSFGSSVVNAKPRHLSIKTSSGSSTGARIQARAAANAFYASPQTRETFYELLGISEGGSLSDVKKAYKQLARKYHPDVSPPERTEEYTKKFIMVQEAYETLSDPHTRALYDRDLARGLHLAFSSRRKSRYDEASHDYEAEEWKKRWQSQLNELMMKNLNRDFRGKMSWGARMRRKRNDIFDLGFN